MRRNVFSLLNCF